MRLGLQTGEDTALSAQPDMQALVQQLVQNRIPAPGLLRIDQVATIYCRLSILPCQFSTVFCTVDCLQAAIVLTCLLCDFVGTMKMQGIDTIFELHAKVCCFV